MGLHSEYKGEEAVVVGGMVLDIEAIPTTTVHPGTTTPGKVGYAVGGVARNIAECMSKLGARPFIISALGFDWAGELLLERWIAGGLSIEGIRRRNDIRTAVICNIFDGKGELGAAVADAESLEKFLTPEWTQKFEFIISSAPVLIVDANLSHSALLATCEIARKYNTPLWFEPVSVKKSERVASVVKYINYTSPNEDELVAMANALSSHDKFLPVRKEESSSIEALFLELKPSIQVLLDKGIEIVLVTLGPEGVLLCYKTTESIRNRSRAPLYNRELYDAVTVRCSKRQIFIPPASQSFIAIHFPAIPASVVRLTGAGDCLVGGVAASICSGLDWIPSIAVGIATAKVAVETESNVPTKMDFAQIADDANIVLSKAKVVFMGSKL